MADDIDHLGKLLEIRFLHRQTAFMKVCKEESRLRGALTRLERLAKQSDQTSNAAIRSIGADVIWNAWVGRTKAALNRELALVLAQKDTMLGAVRKEYGRVIAANELSSQRRDTDHKTQQSRALLQSIGMHKGRK